MRRVVRLLSFATFAFAVLPANADTLTLTSSGTLNTHAGQGSGGLYLATEPYSSTVAILGSSQSEQTENTFRFPVFILPTGAVVTGATVDFSFSPTITGPVNSDLSTMESGAVKFGDYTPGQAGSQAVTRTSVVKLSVDALQQPASGYLGTCSVLHPGSSVDLLQSGFGACLTVPYEYYYVTWNSVTTLYPILESAGYNAWELFDFQSDGSVPVTANLSITYTPAATPEPPALVLGLTGVLGIGVLTMRRRTPMSCA